MKIKEIVSYIEEIAPISYQESYDNSGLQIGKMDTEVDSALLTVDITEEVIDEAILKNIKLIISHHPLIFGGVKRINGANFVERIIIKAIKNDIGIYSAHTNIDNVENGINAKICEKLELQNCKILVPRDNELLKLVTFVPISHLEMVKEAIFNTGAGHIGKYDCCSFSAEGTGTFRAQNDANPFVGKIGEIHHEKESKLETIIPRFLKNKVINALLKVHPYEEVAYDIFPLENKLSDVGAGMIGELKEPIEEIKFFNHLKKTFNLSIIRHTELSGKKIKKIAVCGGSGSSFLKNAIAAKADIFITGDFKYHQFFDAEGKIIIADVGHYESEQFSVELFNDILKKNIPNFALYLSEIKTNPINYY
ncbi:MAG TPA: Nif3-like dinuclear metal center hexameric protein [Bacteroidales bacterium]|nr:MAG: Nif3-like dinuclear metal center hexameric protein [Bacteroidetes bacterium GWF2_33_38]HBF88862.1 Nif3-like dinuclear metal center hexameric protein [Bacteroidales bacterium]